MCRAASSRTSSKTSASRVMNSFSDGSDPCWQRNAIQVLLSKGLKHILRFMRCCTTSSIKLFHRLPNFGALALAWLQTAAFSVSGAGEAADVSASARAAAMLRGVHRIVFLGDSITQAGDYIVDCQCWLLAHGFEVE